jgi:hypothetical protein
MIAGLLVVALLGTLAVGCAGIVYARHRIDEALDEARAVARFEFDLDAVRAAGDRAYLAVRAEQATRVPRRERGRHLAVVA